MILVPNVTLATAADARPIAEMSREHIEYGLGWSWTPSRVLKAIHDDSTNVALIHERAGIAGFGIMCYGEQKGHLVLLCIAPAQRHRGLGALLLGWLEKCAITAGLEKIQLEARADNPAALDFYAEQGYQRTGTAQGYYRGTVDAVRLEKKLRIGPPPA